MMMNKFITKKSLTKSHFIKQSLNKQRLVHDGALPGGFTQEALAQWAQHTLKDDKEPYADLFSESISFDCNEYLKHQPHPSSDLTKCFFGSNRFIPERYLLTPFFFRNNNHNLPNVFSTNEKFLAWTVIVHSPLETICTWEFGQSVKGCTMIGFDPKLRRVYHGNCIHSSVTDKAFFHASLPIHVRYAKFLLNGMVYKIESQSRVASDKKRMNEKVL